MLGGSQLAAGGGETGKTSASAAASSADVSVAGSARVTGTKVGAASETASSA
jgi:hypothetical protein